MCMGGIILFIVVVVVVVVLAVVGVRVEVGMVGMEMGWR